MIISITTYLFEVSAVSASYTQPCVNNTLPRSRPFSAPTLTIKA